MSKSHCTSFSLSSLVPFLIGGRRKVQSLLFIYLFCLELRAKADKSCGIQAKPIKNICGSGDGSIKWWPVWRHKSSPLSFYLFFLLICTIKLFLHLQSSSCHLRRVIRTALHEGCKRHKEPKWVHHFSMFTWHKNGLTCF